MRKHFLPLFPYLFALFLVFALFGCGGGGGGPIGSPPGPIGNRLSGVSLGPYLRGNPNNGDSVSESDLRAILPYVSLNFFGVRTYGATHGLERFPGMAKGAGLYMAAGCWLGRDMQANETELNSLISLCQQGVVDIAIVGSETLFRNDLSEAQLISYINRVKLTGVKVTTADTWSELLNSPAVRDACDEIWINIHPYWEGVAIEEAVSTLDSMYGQVVAVANGKKVVLSETGWPYAGGSNGAAVANAANASRYFREFVLWAVPRNVEFYYFEAFDEPWKAQFGSVERHWGIWDEFKRLKPGMESGFLASP